MRQLPLRARHEVSGAVFVDRAGWEVPASYASLDAEVGAVRTHAGVIDLSDRVKVRLSGPDRVTFLNGLVTADVATLTPGRWTYSLLLNPKGKVVGDLWVYALEDAFLLDLLADEGGWVLDHIRKHVISDDVEIQALPFSAEVGLYGPAAPTLLERVLPARVSAPGPGEFRTLTADRRSILVGSSDFLRVPGFTFVSWSDPLDEMWRTLTASGATLGAGAVPIGREAWNVLRLEAGRPRSGVDMDETTIALEARMESAISFTKGCYEGQEVIARATYQGHMNRLLVGFRIEGDTVPSRGDRVLGPDGGEIGRVTSAAWSPTLRYVIAMGYVRRPNDLPGTRVRIESDGWQLRTAVAPLPFVRG